MDALTNCLFPKKARILHKYSTRLVLNHPSVGSQFHSPPGAWEEERLMALSRKKNTSEHCFIWMTVVWDAVRGGRKFTMLKMKRNIPGKRKRSRAALSFYYVGPLLSKENQKYIETCLASPCPSWISPLLLLTQKEQLQPKEFQRQLLAVSVHCVPGW